jgi:hypothetical protein
METDLLWLLSDDFSIYIKINKHLDILLYLPPPVEMYPRLQREHSLQHEFIFEIN